MVVNDFTGDQIPDVLLSGDHAKIEAWRREAALQTTIKHRPDLLQKVKMSFQTIF